MIYFRNIYTLNNVSFKVGTVFYDIPVNYSDFTFRKIENLSKQRGRKSLMCDASYASAFQDVVEYMENNDGEHMTVSSLTKLMNSALSGKKF